MSKSEIQDIFATYEKPLRAMFRFYAAQDKKDLDYNLERSMNTLNFREFIRFNY